MWKATTLALVWAALTQSGSAIADEAGARRFLAAHCVSCHSGTKPKGDLNLDKLANNFDDATVREHWHNALKRVQAGEMPPKDKPRPPVADVRAVAEWVGEQTRLADAKRAAEGRVVLRRLNRIEYENTVRDLLGVQVNLRDLLPEDSSAHGFDNVGEALHSSSFLMEKYLEAADLALSRAIANLPKPPFVQKRYSLKDERLVKTTTESVYRSLDDGLVMFSSSAWNSITVGQFYPPDRGRYRIRLSVQGYQSSGKPVVFRVDAGPMLMGTKSHLVSYFDALPDKATVIEFTDYFEARDHFRISPYGLATAHTLNKIGADKYTGPGLLVHWVEAEGPLHDTWPPESHRRIFGDLAQISAPIYNYRQRVEVDSRNPEADAERILNNFARRAFRRAVTPAEIKPILDLVTAKLKAKNSFEQAVRVGLMGIMMSPDFLFRREKPGRLDDFALASRLSYFLWSSMPDDELLALAEQKKLGEAATLRGQVERMLQSPKAGAFVENFVGQWLGLREIDFTEPSHILYPEFDDMLKVSMVREAELFFSELLTNDLSVSNFISSDFTMLNGRLAKHYGIPGVDGWEFRRVKLPASSHRGGVLTMAAVLKVTANGTSTSPVMRGAWVLDRILGEPPPKPPADVPAIEPDIRGATTIREQLAKHRQIASCASCHVKIDPPGFALESFDVIGGWREHYRTTGNGKPVTVDGRRMAYHEGRKVDPSDSLPDGRKFQNIDEFKAIMLTDKEKVARSLTRKLATYATGAGSDSGDDKAINDVLTRVQDGNFGLRSLLHELVQSNIFRSK